MPNSKLIKARMAELELTQKDLAKALNLAPATISQKINNIRPLYLDEALSFAEILHIKDSDFRNFFLTNNLRNAKHKKEVHTTEKSELAT